MLTRMRFFIEARLSPFTLTQKLTDGEVEQLFAADKAESD